MCITFTIDILNIIFKCYFWVLYTTLIFIQWESLKSILNITSSMIIASQDDSSDITRCFILEMLFYLYFVSQGAEMHNCSTTMTEDTTLLVTCCKNVPLLAISQPWNMRGMYTVSSSYVTALCTSLVATQ